MMYVTRRYCKNDHTVKVYPSFDEKTSGAYKKNNGIKMR